MLHMPHTSPPSVITKPAKKKKTAFLQNLLHLYFLNKFTFLRTWNEKNSHWTVFFSPLFAYFWLFNASFQSHCYFLCKTSLLLDVTLCGLPANACERSSRWLPWQPGPTHPTRHSHSVKHPFSNKLEMRAPARARGDTNAGICTVHTHTHEHAHSTHTHTHTVGQRVTGFSGEQRCFISRKHFFPF